jgi:hypothetical protein
MCKNGLEKCTFWEKHFSFIVRDRSGNTIIYQFRFPVNFKIK